MESGYQRDHRASNHKTARDIGMGGVENSMNTMPTGGYNNDYQEPPQHPPPQNEDYPSSQSAASPNLDSDPNSRYPSSNSGYQQHNPNSRPSSGLSGGGGYSQTYQDQNQRSSHQDVQKAQSSVVIKVGMVGDAQIGKTSLMVKYVEGSWDEDYIQTLGKAMTINDG